MNDNNKPIAEFDITKLEYPVALPCNARCPVCGSADAKREYDPYGSEYLAKTNTMFRYNYMVRSAEEDKNEVKIATYKKILEAAVAEVNAAVQAPCIKNTCLCCGYTYDTKPLNVQ